MAGSFFPFNQGLAENQEFKSMSSVHRLYLLLLVSEFNLRRSFYKADQECAVTLSVSLNTIRRARQRLQDLGWIATRPGFLEKGKRPVATTFFNVSFSQVREGELFGRIHRYAFMVLLQRLREGRLGHREILAFFYFHYLRAKYGKEKENFYISKRELRQLSGLANVPEALLKLGQYPFFGGKEKTLFEAVDSYHRIQILKLVGFADPEDDEGNRKLASQYQADIRKRLEEAKEKLKKKRQKRQRKKTMVPKSLPEEAPPQKSGMRKRPSGTGPIWTSRVF